MNSDDAVYIDAWIAYHKGDPAPMRRLREKHWKEVHGPALRAEIADQEYRNLLAELAVAKRAASESTSHAERELAQERVDHLRRLRLDALDRRAGLAVAERTPTDYERRCAMRPRALVMG